MGSDEKAADGAVKEFSAAGANPDLPGFTEKALDNHWTNGKSDHSKDYKGFTKEQYAERALVLIRSPVGGSIDGYRASDGSIVRYDRDSNDWVRGHNTGIATMFKPKQKEIYYDRWLKTDKGVTEDE